MAAADLPIGNEGPTNGTTKVTILAAPGANKQRVVPANGVSFYNADSVAHVYTVQKLKNATTTIVWVSASTAAGATVLMPKKTTLDAIDESLEAVVDANLTTTESTFDVSAGECS